MAKTVLFLAVITVLASCGNYEGRKTNCWSGGPLAFAPPSSTNLNCSEWIDVNG